MQSSPSRAALITPLLLAVLAVPSCKPRRIATDSSSQPADSTVGDPMPAGWVRGWPGRLRLTLVLSQSPDDSLDAPIAALAHSEAFGFTEPVATDAALEPNERRIAVRTILHEESPIASPEEIERHGHGLAPQDRARVSAARSFVDLLFVYDTRYSSLPSLESALRLAGTVAEQYDAYIYDADTRALYTPTAWRDEPVARTTYPLTGAGPHVSIRGVHEGRFARLVTHGMRRFGLPDVVAADVPEDRVSGVTHALRVIVDSMVHSPSNAEAGFVVVDLPNDAHGEPRLPVNIAMRIGAAKWRDPIGPLMVVDLRQERGADWEARYTSFLSRLGVAVREPRAPHAP